MNRSHPLAALQGIAGVVFLAAAVSLYVLDRTTPPTHFIGPRFFAILLAPPGVGLIVSGLALRFRWPGWQLFQLAPWLAIAVTIAWFRSLR